MGDTTEQSFLNWIERRRRGGPSFQQTRISYAAEQSVRVYDAQLVHLRGLQARADQSRALLNHHFTLEAMRSTVQMDVQLGQSAFGLPGRWFRDNLDFLGGWLRTATVVPVQYVPAQHAMPFDWHFARWERNEQEHAMNRHTWRLTYGTEFPAHPAGPDGMYTLVEEVQNLRDRAQRSVDQSMRILRLMYEAEAVDTLAQPTRSRTRSREQEAIDILQDLGNVHTRGDC